MAEELSFPSVIRCLGGLYGVHVPLRRTLEQRPPEQRHRLHHAEGHARRTAARDPCGARPEVGAGAETTADSSPASRLTFSPRPLGEFLLVGVHPNAPRNAGAETHLPVCRPFTRSSTPLPPGPTTCQGEGRLPPTWVCRRINRHSPSGR